MLHGIKLSLQQLGLDGTHPEYSPSSPSLADTSLGLEPVAARLGW